MGYYCTVPQCTSLAGKTKNVKFHRFPRDTSMADRWNVILRRGKPYTKYSKVCSLHFTQGDYNVTTMGQWKTLSKDAVPSQNLPKLNPDGSVMVIRKSRTVKYRESRKDESDKSDKWILPSHTTIRDSAGIADIQADNEANIAYRLQALSAVASTLSSTQSIPVPLTNQTISIPHPQLKPRKQDAFMQTDPVQSEEDETQPNNSYSEASENSFNSELETYPYQARGSPYQKQVSPYQKEVTYQKDPLTKEEYVKYEKEKEYAQYQKETRNEDKKFELPKDYTKQEDYIPQTNEEYNKEAEKYALERKSHNGYEKVESAYQKSVPETQYQKQDYQKSIQDQYQKLPDTYQKLPEIYSFSENEYQNRTDYVGYQNGYPDSEILRNKQHNLEILQETHRVTENQNFFNESHIKQEIDINSEEEKFLYERTKDQLVADANSMYNSSVTQQRLLEQLQHHVKQEPESNACESVMQPQGSPYYANGHNNGPAGFYEPLSRPGPEMLIAKQNALAAHTQLWQNTMKRPFFYTETSNFAAPQLLHRHTEGYNRVLQ